jgi:glycosyltransferase involved in cell wall biosynthesis
MDRKIKILVIGDGVTPTGFSRVIHSIFGRLDTEEYDIHHLAVNYHGDPHGYNHKIYPAMVGGDVYGINRLQMFAAGGFDIIFLLNDAWILDIYLDAIKKKFKKLPKIVAYFPVDAEFLHAEWFKNFDIVTQAVVYTNFGKKEVKKAMPELDVKIIAHGVDIETFYKMPLEKAEIKKLAYPPKEEFYDDSFIVLNANRNQPRKKIDIAVAGFSLFAEGKPLNVKYYHHAGLVDMGWDIRRLADRYGINKRLILSNLEGGVQRVSEERLNLIYNATDVGLNTSVGEGFGLTQVEHSATGSPQVVPNNSASGELFKDCGILIPAKMEYALEKVTTIGKLVRPEDVAKKLELLYSNRELLKERGELCYKKFTSEKYSWDAVAKIWDNLFKSVLEDDDNISE